MMSVVDEPGAAIQISDLTVTYARRSADTRALSGVNLNIGPGQFVSVVGASGAGKSSLLHAIAGVIGFQGGLKINNTNVGDAQRNKLISFVPQGLSLLPWRSVSSNIALPFVVNKRAERRSKRDLAGRVENALESVGLVGLGDRYPHELSGGQRQRVAVARAFVNGSPLLLLDEPFAALDDITRAQQRALLHQQWLTHRCTAILVTHNLADAVLLSDRVVVLNGHPGQVAGEVRVDLAHPRPENVDEAPQLLEALRKVRALLSVEPVVAS